MASIGAATATGTLFTFLLLCLKFDVSIRFDFEIHVNISSDNFRPKKKYIGLQRPTRTRQNATGLIPKVPEMEILIQC